MKRHGTQMIYPAEKQESFYTWKQLGEGLSVPPDWLRKHCLKMLKMAIINHNGFDFNLDQEEKVIPKGKLIIPYSIQLMFVDQQVL
jgi:hypothetical protein